MNALAIIMGFLILVFATVFFSDFSGNEWLGASYSVGIGLIGGILLRIGLKTENGGK